MPRSGQRSTRIPGCCFPLLRAVAAAAADCPKDSASTFTTPYCRTLSAFRSNDQISIASVLVLVLLPLGLEHRATACNPLLVAPSDSGISRCILAGGYFHSFGDDRVDKPIVSLGISPSGGQNRISRSCQLLSGSGSTWQQKGAHLGVVVILSSTVRDSGRDPTNLGKAPAILTAGQVNRRVGHDGWSLEYQRQYRLESLAPIPGGRWIWPATGIWG